jgi:hypothetical protein
MNQYENLRMAKVAPGHPSIVTLATGHKKRWLGYNILFNHAN